MKTITFKDRVKLYVRAGNGGNGISSFRREKFVPKGGPDGGDGGHGGSVYMMADKNTDSLLDLYYRPHQKAQHGEPGRGKKQHGKTGADLTIKVPCGTIACDFESGEWIGEVIEEGDRLLLAQGGKGGLGNCHFTSSTHQSPTEFTPGTEGEQVVLRLELKLVADVALVGYPNAGKSTLLSRLSHAHPKVAPYPFTTLNPVIGTMTFEDYKTLTVADIPGLINGAHEGVGLGYDFLRHIERTRLLVFIVDIAGVDGRHPAEDFRNIRKEIKLYRDDLAERPHIVVANKMDLDNAAEGLAEFEKETGISPLAISAEENSGVEELKLALYDFFHRREE
ncbi:MAG: GTPase ObgE [Verrucomicrobia bacterium]|nr:GTPase ObgE [Verrucomicrobiota bacterium]